MSPPETGPPYRWFSVAILTAVLLAYYWTYRVDYEGVGGNVEGVIDNSYPYFSRFTWLGCRLKDRYLKVKGQHVDRSGHGALFTAIS